MTMTEQQPSTRTIIHAREPRSSRNLGSAASRIGAHSTLAIYSVIAIVPILLIVMNSFKTTSAIFDNPFALPTADTFSVDGYASVVSGGEFGLYFWNSFLVSVSSLTIVLALASAAGYALSTYTSRAAPVISLLFAAGLMLPIRLGSVSILETMISLGLINTLTALILVYVAMSMPLAVMIMTQFMGQVPKENKEAARIDGAGELRVMWMTLPIVKPGLAAVATVSLLPIWNDLWFPLILAPGESTRTVTLGVQQFVGQYTTDVGAVLSALTLSAIPLVLLFIVFSKQFVSGLTAGSSR